MRAQQLATHYVKVESLRMYKCSSGNPQMLNPQMLKWIEHAQSTCSIYFKHAQSTNAEVEIIESPILSSHVIYQMKQR